MKKITILASALMLAGIFQANAQMGIGTPNPSDATMLDVVASDKGVLIPRVALNATDDFSPITGTELESILVYNTFTSADLEVANAVWPGFYYWKDNEWQRIINQADLYAAIDDLGDTFNESIEQIHDLINYIAPSNPNNVDEDGNPIVTEDHSTVVWDGTSFFLVTYDATTQDYVKTIIDLEALIEGAETNTFIRVETTADEPDVYHYFSEEAIKTWKALDPANNTDAYADMAVTEPGVVTIDVVGDVVDNFLYILNQEITYEGDQVSIEKIIQLISQEVEGNVIYTEINGEWVFQYFDGSDYVTIDLGDLVANLETNTFIKKVAGVVDANDPSNNTPTVYYYFSEEAIKTWLADDPTNEDPETNMPNDAPGVLPIQVTEDVAADFEFILNQEITYEGDTHTIEEIIQMISKDVEGNVIYTEVNGEWVFQYFDGSDYVTIDLTDLVAEAETNTFIKKVAGVVDANDPSNNTPTVYYYFSETAIKDWLADDPTNVDPEANMPNNAPGVLPIEVTEDVAADFEFILNQEITYEGDTHTIEQIIQMISQEVVGNVIYKEINGEWVFQYFDGDDYVTIDLGDLVANLETNTFIKKVAGVVDANDPSNNTPTVYYYFSEEAIKTWLADDPTNEDPETNMPHNAPGVLPIQVTEDVAADFEFILNQEITYEGDTHTIEQIIQMISQEVEGNVIYEQNDNSEWVFKYYNSTTEEYEEINLTDLVREIETNTFIKVVETSGEPNVYYYFSETAIKAWLAEDSANENPETNMPVSFNGVVKLDVVGDVVENFEYILEQEITYEGEDITIEQIIKNISKDVEGNVIYEQNDNSEWVFKYYDSTTEEYEEINLTDLVAEAETKTKITRATIDADGDAPNYIDTVAPVDAETKLGEVLYKYDSEDGEDFLNITEDILHSLENNEDVKNIITEILEEGGGVFFGDIEIGGDNYTDVLYYYDDNGDAQLIDVSNTLIENLKNSVENTLELKRVLGDKISNTEVVYTGDTIDGSPVVVYKGETSITGAHSAETTGVNISLPAGVTLEGVVSVGLYQSGILITEAVTDVAVNGSTVNFNIGVGTFYQVLPAGTYEVILYLTVNE